MSYSPKIHTIIGSSFSSVNAYEHLPPETVFLSGLPDDHLIVVRAPGELVYRITLGALRSYLTTLPLPVQP